MQNNPWEPMLDETNKHYFEHKLRGRKLTPETEIRYREYILSGTIGEVYAGFINEIDSLRNVIESQKEEIASHGPEGRNYTNQQYVELLQKFESLKAITELAVKGLKEIDSYKKGEALVYVQEIKALAKSTISEIERLSQ